MLWCKPMNSPRAYLDHNATSPLKEAARTAMLEAVTEGGNASSIHAEGRAARHRIEAAREKLAQSLGVIPQMVVFTSSGSEANNLAIKGAPVERLIIGATEHPCVLEAAKASGKPMDILLVDQNGQPDLNVLDALLAKPGKALVSLMLANNETGIIAPISQVADHVRAADGLLHTDAVQAFGKMTLRMPILGADMLTISAHKFGGPIGAAALIIRDGVAMAPLIHGGGQELRRRAGTENVAAIAGLAAAIGDLPKEIKALRDDLESFLQAETPAIQIFGKASERLSNTSCFALPGIAADTALISLDLDGVAVSSGSACSSGKVGKSHVLSAMGIEEKLAKSALRVSLGWNTSVKDIELFKTAWKRTAARANQKAA